MVRKNNNYNFLILLLNCFPNQNFMPLKVPENKKFSPQKLHGNVDRISRWHSWNNS